MKYLFILFSLLLFSVALRAQTPTRVIVAGQVADSTGEALVGASVVLLRAADSVLTGYATTGADGSYLIRRVPAGTYVLKATYVGYLPGVQTLEIKDGQTGRYEAGVLRLEQNNVLGEVSVTADVIPIQIIGDTVQYNANAFKTQPGAVVEDLLKKLPGVEVGRDGTIRAQGEQVQQVLVDGKEFFGNDPQIATKNLPADAVDKVQVFDKKSDRAEFTGVDDGQRSRTINLALKEDKKQGAFGNVTAGAGTDERYEGRFSLNRFSNNYQLSGIGMLNNTNQAGFSFEDYLGFLGGMQGLMGGGGGGGRQVRIQFNADDGSVPVGLQPARGFTTTGAGGANVNFDFSKRAKLNASYFYNRVDTDLDRFTTRQNLLAGNGAGQFNTEEQENRNSLVQQHRINGTLRLTPDSAQNLIWRFGAGWQDGAIGSRLNTLNYLAQASTLANAGQRAYDADRTGHQLNSSLGYRRRLGKPGRALVADVSANWRDNLRTGLIDAENRFYNNPGQSDTLTVHQRQEQTDGHLQYAASASYTEPIGRGQYLELTGSMQNYRNELVKDFYDRITGGEVRNNALSNEFVQDYRYRRGELTYRLARSKYNATLGVGGQQSLLDGTARADAEPFGRSFFNVLPTARFEYRFGVGRDFSFDYETDVREPSLEQLQPVVDNSDPLSLYQGNPALRPAYNHNGRLHFLYFDQFSLTSFFANLATTYTTNSIANARSIDSLLRQITRPVNTPYEWQLNGFVSYATPLKFMKSTVRVETGNRYTRGFTFVNDVRNTTNRLNTSIDVSLDNRRKEVFDLSGGVRFERNASRFSIQRELGQTFYTTTYYADATVKLGKRWSLNTALDYAVFTGPAFPDRLERPLWRASITHYMLKNNRGQLRLAVFDLLDRNAGIQRTVDVAFLQEERVPTLARYALLSFTYNLSDFTPQPNVAVRRIGR